VSKPWLTIWYIAPTVATVRAPSSADATMPAAPSPRKDPAPDENVPDR
jgi:hypothetical protein